MKCFHKVSSQREISIEFQETPVTGPRFESVVAKCSQQLFANNGIAQKMAWLSRNNWAKIIIR